MTPSGFTPGLALALLALALPARAQDQTEALLAKSRAASATFSDQLRAQLAGAMENGGPTLAVAVCKDASPVIAREVGTQLGAALRRTSLRPRNPAAEPDAWERATLEQFDARRAAGEDPMKIEASTWADGPQGRSFRYMKALPTAEMCLQCHGATLKPEVAARIREAYPGDLATGYAPGDIRGAVSVTWTDPRP